MAILKRLAARLSPRWQAELKRIHFARQIAGGRFDTSEAEFQFLSDLVQPDDWVLDVGANVGQYTKRLSDLVGPAGRVLAFEPVPATFALLAANAERFAHANVSLFNVALSTQVDLATMSIPRFATGLVNYYEARLQSNAREGVRVLTIGLDSLSIVHRVSLVKIDAEGHEAFVIAGMRKLIDRFQPAIILETGSEELLAQLAARGYSVDRASGSSNVVCLPTSNARLQEFRVNLQQREGKAMPGALGQGIT